MQTINKWPSECDHYSLAFLCLIWHITSSAHLVSQQITKTNWTTFLKNSLLFVTHLWLTDLKIGQTISQPILAYIPTWHFVNNQIRLKFLWTINKSINHIDSSSLHCRGKDPQSNHTVFTSTTMVTLPLYCQTGWVHPYWFLC